MKVYFDEDRVFWPFNVKECKKLIENAADEYCGKNKGKLHEILQAINNVCYMPLFMCDPYDYTVWFTKSGVKSDILDDGYVEDNGKPSDPHMELRFTPLEYMDEKDNDMAKSAEFTFTGVHVG